MLNERAMELRSAYSSLVSQPSPSPSRAEREGSLSIFLDELGFWRLDWHCPVGRYTMVEIFHSCSVQPASCWSRAPNMWLVQHQKCIFKLVWILFKFLINLKLNTILDYATLENTFPFFFFYWSAPDGREKRVNTFTNSGCCFPGTRLFWSLSLKIHVHFALGICVILTFIMRVLPPRSEMI